MPDIFFYCFQAKKIAASPIAIKALTDAGYLKAEDYESEEELDFADDKYLHWVFFSATRAKCEVIDFSPVQPHLIYT